MSSPGFPSQRPTRRHGRRIMRSSLTGPGLQNPLSRVASFERIARTTVEYLQRELGPQLFGVRIEFCTLPNGDSIPDSPSYWRVDREQRLIMLYRMPIQRAKGLHVDDELHRRMFVEHCVFKAVADFLNEDPWDLLPGQFEHF